MNDDNQNTSVAEDLGYNWRKEAAQRAIPKADSERAFMDSAVGFISNRAGVLMSDPHRLGFEVVWKNEDDTKMVGIFAFRIEDELLYVPVFFLNGSIKGYDLLHRTKSKSFVPFTEDWVIFLADRRLPNIGHGIDHRNSRNTQNSIDMQGLIFPPGHRNKWASAAKEAGASEWEAWFEDISQPTEPPAVLGQFMREDGGQDALTKLAAMIERSPVFAELMNYELDAQDWCAEDIPFLTEDKQAASETSGLVLFKPGIGGAPEGFAKIASTDKLTEFFKRGFYLYDTRKDDLNPVYEYGSQELTLIGDRGVYKVLTADGEWEEAMVAPVAEAPAGFAEAPRDSDMGSDIAGGCYPCGYPGDYTKTPMIAVTKSRKLMKSDRIYGKFCDRLAMEDEDTSVESWTSPKMEAGSAYLVYDTGRGVFSERPVHCLSVDSGEVTVYKVILVNYGHEQPRTLRHNPDGHKNDFNKGLLGRDTRFVRVLDKETTTASDNYPAHTGTGDRCFISQTVDLAGPDQVESLIRSSEFGEDMPVKLSTYRLAPEHPGDPNGWSRLTDNLGHSTEAAGPATMAAFLANNLKVAGITAMAMVDRVVAGEVVEFAVESQKSASAIRLADYPMFEQDYDSDLGMAVQEPQAFELGTTSSYQRPPAMRLGDAADPAVGGGDGTNENRFGNSPGGIPLDTLLHAPPEQIAQLTQSGQFPRAFEHGVVGSLVDTYDSMAMIDKYIPMWEKALDAQGRALFLFYWKPQDFEQAFGVDDMTNIENKLLSNFKSFGDMVLDFLKRTQKSKGALGTSAM
jgi:hypothetical protein